ncbi:sigma-70 family RNA polymerase sigma factor [Demequina aurantiaca]|uniref:sigma-70 family RNA polymerase sigma factor n=1 Tax=Demequina aurantiaca TaxID=676200 RepID=UPI003D3459A0
MSSEAIALWTETSSDPELIAGVRAGDQTAFGLLYERHVEAARKVATQYTNSPSDVDDVVSESFSRVLRALQRGDGPDLAFRAYLFTIVRRTGMDMINKGIRTKPREDMGEYEANLGYEASSDEPALEGFEHGMVAGAFKSLPERWQAVLWYTEVEKKSPKEIAPLLGLSANGVAALAYRAREALRQAYLQQHLNSADTLNCLEANTQLGSYVRGGLNKREHTRIDEHVKTCERCTALVLELQDVNRGMRGIIAPIVLGTLGMGALQGGMPIGGAFGPGATASASSAGTAGAGVSAGASGVGGTAVGATGLAAAFAGASGVLIPAAAVVGVVALALGGASLLGLFSGGSPESAGTQAVGSTPDSSATDNLAGESDGVDAEEPSILVPGVNELGEADPDTGNTPGLQSGAGGFNGSPAIAGNDAGAGTGVTGAGNGSGVGTGSTGAGSGGGATDNGSGSGSGSGSGAGTGTGSGTGGTSGGETGGGETGGGETGGGETGGGETGGGETGGGETPPPVGAVLSIAEAPLNYLEVSSSSPTVSMSVSNSGDTNAGAMQATVTLPTGLLFSAPSVAGGGGTSSLRSAPELSNFLSYAATGSFGAGDWSCELTSGHSSVVCGISDLAAGESAELDLTVAIDTFTGLDDAAETVFDVVAGDRTAHYQVPTGLEKVNDNLNVAFSARGHVAATTVGSPLMGCDLSLAKCQDVMYSTSSSAGNNSQNMVAINVAGGGRNSAKTLLELPSDAKVLYAALEWSANASVRDATKGTENSPEMWFDSDISKARIQAPGASKWNVIDGTVVSPIYLDGSNRAYYQSRANVTELVRDGGAGEWTVADIALSRSANDNDRTYYGGFALTVIYESPSLPTARVAIFDGSRWVSERASAEFRFFTGSTSTAELGWVAWDSDRSLTGDRAQIDDVSLTPRRWNGPAGTYISADSSAAILGKTNDAADSTAAGSAFSNSLGVDAKSFFPSGNLAAGKHTLRATSTGDNYLLSSVTVTVVSES